MIIPFLAMIVAVVVIIAYLASNSKKKDRGNTPKTDQMDS